MMRRHSVFVCDPKSCALLCLFVFGSNLFTQAGSDEAPASSPGPLLSAAATELVKGERQTVDTRCALAKIRFAQQRYEECRKLCAEILVKDHTNTTIRVLAAVSLAKQKSDIDGVDELKRLVEENKTNLSAQLALIEQLVRLGYREQAGDRVEWLLLQHPNSAPLHYWRALTRYRSGYLEGARDSILRYFGLLPLADIQGSDPIFERALRMLVEFERRLRKIESEKKEP